MPSLSGCHLLDPGLFPAALAGLPLLCWQLLPTLDFSTRDVAFRSLSLHSERDPACFCPVCLPYALNLIEFQGHFQSNLEYEKKRKAIWTQT